MSVEYEGPLPEINTLFNSPSLEAVPAIVPEMSRRLLGNLAMVEEPRNPLEYVVREADTLTLDQTREFAHTMHDVLVAKIQKVNLDKERPANMYVLDPAHVDKGLDVYYDVFKLWQPRVSVARLETLRQEHLVRHTEIARRSRAFYPEINLLIQLEAELFQEAPPEAGLTAHELLAAYGWAAEGNFVARRMELLRHTENADKI